MRCGMATWCYHKDDVPLTDLVLQFADMGFQGVSFLPSQILGLDESGAGELVAAMDRRDLFATVHGNFRMSREDAAGIIRVLGVRLAAMTFDSTMTRTSIGNVFDAARMVELLCQLEELSRGTDLRFGVEDFPLDAAALEHFRKDLEPLLSCERYGMLVDIGHLNIRTRTVEYFRGQSPGEYLRGAPLPIIEIHVHDNDSTKDSHAHIGFGDADFGAVARGLVEAGFDGISTIEICPSFHQSTPAESKPKAAESLELWRRFWDRANG